MSPTRFPKMNKEPVAPPMPERPVAAPVKHIAVSFKRKSDLNSGKTNVTKVFPETDLVFTNRDEINEFYQKHFSKCGDSITDVKLEISARPFTPGTPHPKVFPFTAALSPDMHPKIKKADTWYFGAIYSSKPEAEIIELQRIVAGLRRDLERERDINAHAEEDILKIAKSKAKKMAEKIAQTKVEELFQSYKLNFDAKFESLEKDLMSKSQVQKTEVTNTSVAPVATTTSDTCSMSFKLSNPSVYPLTDGSGLARIVGRLPTHVGAMLLALDKLPSIRNVNGTVVTVTNTGSGLELTAHIKFSQWSNEWLCSWGEDVKVANKPSLITTLSEVNPDPKNVSSTPSYTPTLSVPLASRLSKTSPTSPPRSYPRPAIGCFKDIPPGLSGAQEEIPWVVKVDTPAAADPHPVSEHDTFVCDYCMDPIAESRFHCQSCVDFDVCGECYPSRAKSHAQKHGFVQFDARTGTVMQFDVSSVEVDETDVSTSSVRFPVLDSVSSSGTVAATEPVVVVSRSERSGRSGRSSRSHSQSSFTDVTVDDLLSDIGSYEHVTSDVPDYSDFEEHF